MYRRYRLDVSRHLEPEGQRNTLLIVFSSPSRFLEDLQPPENLKEVPKIHFLRKCHCDFGSYLGARPNSMKMGIFREVYLDMPGHSYIEDVWIRTEPSEDFTKSDIKGSVETAGPDCTLEWLLRSPDEKD